MDVRRIYQRCRVAGEGKFYQAPGGQGVNFDIIDLSASGAKIRAEQQLEINQTIDVAIRFSGLEMEMNMKVVGRVIRKKEVVDGYIYGLEFVNLTEHVKVEMDEVLRRRCGGSILGRVDHCDDGSCIFSGDKRTKTAG